MIRRRQRAWRRRPRPPASLRARVVALVLVLLAVLLAGLFAGVDVLLGSRLQAGLAVQLRSEARVAERLAPRTPPQQLVDRLETPDVTALLCRSGESCLQGRAVPAARGRTPPPPPPPPGPLAAGAAVPAPVATNGELMLSLPLGSEGTLHLLADTATVHRALRQLAVEEAAGGVLALLVAGFALYRLVGVALRPLDEMTAVARQIAAGRRGRRLGPTPAHTELGRTATAFNDMLASLESTEAQLRDFLSDASHELRTPLTTVTASAERLVREDMAAEDVQRVAATVVREAGRASRLVDDVLTMARLRGGAGLHREALHLADVVRAEVHRYRELLPVVRVELHGTEAAYPTVADGFALSQAVGNLLANARQASPPGASVEVRMGSGERSVWVDVVDEGPGVAVEDRERIFERLVRLDPSRSRRGDGGGSAGTGLGLPIARAVARAHGGDVCYVEHDGQGACFRLWLPRESDGR